MGISIASLLLTLVLYLIWISLGSVIYHILYNGVDKSKYDNCSDLKFLVTDLLLKIFIPLSLFFLLSLFTSFINNSLEMSLVVEALPSFLLSTHMYLFITCTFLFTLLLVVGFKKRVKLLGI